MIISYSNLSSLRYFLYGYENCNISSSHFDSFYTSQESGCIYLDSTFSLSVYKSSFTNISTTYSYSLNTASGAAIYSTSATKNLIIVSTCFKDCRSNHGFTFGCFGSDSAVYNQSFRTTSVFFSTKHPSFIYQYDSLISSDTNTTNSLDGTILFNEDQCILRFQLVENSTASPFNSYAHYYNYFFYIEQAIIDFISVIGGSAESIFRSANGVTIGNMYASTSCDLGSLVKSINYLYYSLPFPINKVSYIINSELVESLPNELMIRSINCAQDVTYENLVSKVSVMQWTLLVCIS